jgi:hypothetical protein
MFRSLPYLAVNSIRIIRTIATVRQILLTSSNLDGGSMGSLDAAPRGAVEAQRPTDS